MADIIIDNGAPGTSSTGSWGPSSASDQYTGPGANPTSLYADIGANTYRWTPTIPAEGDYDVFVWWSTHENRGAAVPIVVKHATAMASKTFDERPAKGGGKWVLHGRYHFLAGTAGYIETNSLASQAAADAVKLVPVAAVPPVVVPPVIVPPVSPGRIIATEFELYFRDAAGTRTLIYQGPLPTTVDVPVIVPVP